jgi:hypothetical protein
MMRVEELMATLQPNDHVIWKKKKICVVLERLPSGLQAFLGLPPANAHIPITPYGMTREEHAQICDEAACFRVRDENTGEEFNAHGFDLLYVNPMMVLAVMAKKDEDEQAEG